MMAAPGLRSLSAEPAALFPASFAQRRLWFLDQLVPESAAYNVPLALRIRGALNVAALRASIATLAACHESLRTTFAEVDGEPGAPGFPGPTFSFTMQRSFKAIGVASVGSPVRMRGSPFANALTNKTVVFESGENPV